VVLDRYSNCLMGNGASEQLVAALVDASLLGEHMNHLRLLFHPLGVRRWIVNWDDVSRTMLARAERELGESTDDDATALLSELHSFLGTFMGTCDRRVNESQIEIPGALRRARDSPPTVRRVLCLVDWPLRPTARVR
jgi:hypothetical protein